MRRDDPHLEAAAAGGVAAGHVSRRTSRPPASCLAEVLRDGVVAAGETEEVSRGDRDATPCNVCKGSGVIYVSERGRGIISRMNYLHEAPCPACAASEPPSNDDSGGKVPPVSPEPPKPRKGAFRREPEPRREDDGGRQWVPR